MTRRPRSASLALVVGAVLLSPLAHASQQLNDYLRKLPGPPSFPTETNQCEAWAEPYREIARRATAEHSECLSGQSKEPPGDTCTRASCQQLHDLPSLINKYVNESLSACRDQAYAHQREERDRERQAEEQRQAYLKHQQQQISAQGTAQRQAQKQAYDAAERKKLEEVAKADKDRAIANERASIFSQAAARNAATSASAPDRAEAAGSISSLLGGDLGSTLDALRSLGSSNPSSGSSGSAPAWDAAGGVGTSLLEKTAVLAETFEWGDAPALRAASDAVALGGSIGDVWDTWTAYRSGDTLAAAGGSAALLGDIVLPAHAAFFAVPAIRAVTAVHGAALAELDRAFASFDYVSSDGGYIPAGTYYQPDFRAVQYAYVQELCDACVLAEEGRRWLVGQGVLVQSDEGDEPVVDVGWDPVENALGY